MGWGVHTHTELITYTVFSPIYLVPSLLTVCHQRPLWRAPSRGCWRHQLLQPLAAWA